MVVLEKTSWHKVIQEYVDSVITDDEFLKEKDKFTFNIKKEFIFIENYLKTTFNKGNVIPHYWLPNWSDEKDPSARELRK